MPISSQAAFTPRPKRSPLPTLPKVTKAPKMPQVLKVFNSARTLSPNDRVPLQLMKPDIVHRYLRHTEINRYLDYLRARFPANVKLHTIGQSYEQRPIMAIEIDFMSKNRDAAFKAPAKPKVPLANVTSAATPRLVGGKVTKSSATRKLCTTPLRSSPLTSAASRFRREPLKRPSSMTLRGSCKKTSVLSSNTVASAQATKGSLHLLHQVISSGSKSGQLIGEFKASSSRLTAAGEQAPATIADRSSSANAALLRKTTADVAAEVVETPLSSAKCEEGHVVLNTRMKPLKRNLIFIEAGTHAREWISISVALHCIHQLTEKHNRYMDVLAKMRFFIVPLTNPDGYEFCRAHNRRWRKNRRPTSTSNIGTDCNRNYDINWECGSNKTHRCTYRGDKPFSEPETRAINETLKKLEPQLMFVLSLHSYAQAIMYPWGYTKQPCGCGALLAQVAESGRFAIAKSTGRHYRCGSISSLNKRTIPGSLIDYAFAKLNIPVALVMELPSNALGFQPPVEMIQALCCESWTGIYAMCLSAWKQAPRIIQHKLVSSDVPPMPLTSDAKDSPKEITSNDVASSQAWFPKSSLDKCLSESDHEGTINGAITNYDNSRLQKRWR